jgi:hypothetical protein
VVLNALVTISPASGVDAVVLVRFRLMVASKVMLTPDDASSRATSNCKYRRRLTSVWFVTITVTLTPVADGTSDFAALAI